MKEEKKVCHYLDLPIQHAKRHDSQSVWDAARRKHELLDIIGKLREKRSRISSLRTTLITGFPGETEEQHEELMDFVDEMEFERLGVFTYSPGGGYSGSRDAEDQIPEEVKQERQQ